MQVALYARVSTSDKRQDTENQLAQLSAFAASQKWTVVHEYVDRATGKRSDREQFQRLFEDASRHKFDLVLFWSLDRFSREGVLETLHHLQAGAVWRGLPQPHRAVPRQLRDLQRRGALFYERKWDKRRACVCNTERTQLKRGF
jgi:hypothetical protein